MPIKPTEKIWHNGKLIPWNQATLHVMSHVVNYGSSVFEGIRCYALPRARPSSAPRNMLSVCWIPPRSTASTWISPSKTWSAA